MITWKMLQFYSPDYFFLLRVIFDKFNIFFYFYYLRSNFWGGFLSKISFWLSRTSHENGPNNDLHQLLLSLLEQLCCKGSFLFACAAEKKMQSIKTNTTMHALKLFSTGKQKLHEVTRQPWCFSSFAFWKALIGGQESAF